MRKCLNAFTLIELLIVVAIIAILAAIAVPNLLEAQIRGKVTRTVADMRSLNIGMQVYRIDHNAQPIPEKATGGWYGDFLMLQPFQGPSRKLPGTLLTTPIAYLSSIPFDIFTSDMIKIAPRFGLAKGTRVSFPTSMPIGSTVWVSYRVKFGAFGGILFPLTAPDWFMESTGPDLAWWDDAPNGNQADPNPFFYDPTNGTVSKGQVVYFSTGKTIPVK